MGKTMPAIHQVIPNAEDLASDPEEAAAVLLQFINSGGEGSSPQRPLKRGNLFTPSVSPANGYPPAN